MVLKLVLPWEDLATQAAAAMGDCDPMLAPWTTVDFLDIECANVLANTAGAGVIDRAYAIQSLGVVADLPMTRWPAARVLASALELSCAHGISAYDACYVALADALGVALLTADHKLARKLGGTRHAIVQLGEIDG